MSKRLDITTVPKNYDRRIKLTPEQRAEIAADTELSQRALARKYGVSRRLVTFIQHPERYETCKAQFRERRKNGRYYDRQQNTQAVKSNRRYKRALVDAGKIELAK